ncbi:2-hydroxychromene-2-carboxylate isomerase (plasmid) [Variovorax sp. V59]|uniref:hypothetical protein n=1 Tax=unclassified Variovorax TaxID=663243 RepID=UPI0034E85D4D
MLVDLPAVYACTGGVLLPLRAPERQASRVAELRRWCRRLGMHVNPQPKFMFPDATLASCIVIAAGAAGHDVVPLYKAILHAQWCADLDISSPQTLAEILQAWLFWGQDRLDFLEEALAKSDGARVGRLNVRPCLDDLET